MNAIKKVKKSQINEHLLESRYAFICFSSFEQRSFTVPLSLDAKAIDIAFVLKSSDIQLGKSGSENVIQIQNHIKICELRELKLNNPVNVADIMTDIIREIIKKSIYSIVVDISTFTHETLLILLRLIYDNREKFYSIYCLYNGASKYSGGDAPEKMWLSKGCNDVRNVIGYPGMLNPLEKTHLILLTGYEKERAIRLIEILEPDILSLGDGNEPIEANHEEAMKFFKGEFENEKWKNNFQGITCNTFTFSCRDVKKTIKILNNIVNCNSKKNYILVPMNTKLSTVAAAIVALRNPKIQVCYAVPEIYNINNYSEPSNNITIVKLNEIKEFIQ
jgi:hypothetical protein